MIVKKMRTKHILTIAVVVLLVFSIIGSTTISVVNAYVKNSVKNNIISTEEAEKLSDVDCIIVLGCLVRDDGTPSDMLADRLTRGVLLYKQGIAPKMIMSGDHGHESYDEVNAMKLFAIDAGVPSNDIFMDHAGFSTYESVYRAKAIFGAEKVIIVTQEYHLYRALYIAEELGIEAYGVDADYHTYRGQTKRDIREIFARCKDFINVMLKPLPTYLGEPIPLYGDGNITNG